MRYFILITGMIIFFAAALVLSQEVPEMINYQGRLLNADGAPVADGTYEITFSLYNAEQAKLWDETLMVEVGAGLFSVTLGQVNPLGEVIISNPPPLFLGIKIGTDPELEPRTPLASGPYSLLSLVTNEAALAHSLDLNTIHDGHIIDGTISLADLGPNGASEGHIIKMGPEGWVIAEDETSPGPDDDWTFDGSVLYTSGEWGIARAGNVLYGIYDSTHVNLGVACSTGVAGLDDWYVTVGGGLGNHAGSPGATIAGGYTNSAHGVGATVGGGVSNMADGTGATVAGGSSNQVAALDATVAGGNINVASGDFSTVAGGQGNQATDTVATVAGGKYNMASGPGSAILGGFNNKARGRYSLVAGGGGLPADSNSAMGDWSVILGGKSNVAAGDYSFAAGRNARALHPGAFVWSDSIDTEFYSAMDNEFAIKSANGMRVHADNSEYDVGVENLGNGDGVRIWANTSRGYTYGAVFAYNTGTSPGIYATSTQGYAGYFDGDINVTGSVDKAASAYKIDHPLDPENRYLSHSTVSSPDMMNIYNGNITLDAYGMATVNLPEYFQALNQDFRYQLTAIGMPGPNLYIAEEISENSFRIAGGEPGMKVSWQVTGIRSDAYANVHRTEVVADKSSEERGYYLHPKSHGLSPEMGIIKPSDHEKKRNIKSTEE
jgi:hypothetical protein